MIANCRVLLQLIARSARMRLWPYIGVIATATALSSGLPFTQAIYIGIVLCLAASSGFVVNDLWDRKVDRMNARGRLENASSQALIAAGAASACLAILSLLFSHFSAVPHLIAATSGVLLGLFIYTLALRKVLFLATALAAGLASSPVWLPIALAPTAPSEVHRLLLTTAVLHMYAREVVIDINDRRGDSAFRRFTIPVVFGQRVAANFALVVALGGLLSAASCLLALPLSWVSVAALSAAVAASIILFVRPLIRVVRVPSVSSVESAIASSRVACMAIPLLILLPTYFHPGQ